MKKIGFVTPWYGENIKGGAEADLRNLVAQMRRRNIDVEVLTTCVAGPNSDWSKNVLPSGFKLEQGIPVRRFLADPRNAFEFAYVNSKLTGGQYILSDEDERRFVEHSINSREMYRYIRDHANEYEAFGYIPYLFGTTYYGVMQCPQKAFLIPCFHDEQYAYLRNFRRVYSTAAGMAFHSEPEASIAEKLYHTKNMELKIVGSGMDMDFDYDPQDFCNKYNIKEPFILYAGRKDRGKNVDTLILFFEKYIEKNAADLKLLLIGGGDVDIPSKLKKQIIDLGYIDKQDKYNAYAAANFLCQPSKNESFSLVIMESWLCKRPVLVCEECKVTTNFVRQAQGGLYFSDYTEFEKTVSYLLKHKDIAQKMGENGKRYVESHFTWDKVISDYCELIKGITEKNEENSIC